MARPQIRAGELGNVVVRVLPSGRYRARASFRDDSGALHRLATTDDTEHSTSDRRLLPTDSFSGRSCQRGNHGGWSFSS